jgi:hypothetical protein
VKIGKEVKIKNFNNHNIIFGTVDNKTPKTLYIIINSWIEPKNDTPLNYFVVNREFNKKIRQFIFKSLKNNEIKIFNDEIIMVDFDIKESGIKFGKKSFMNCEITLVSNSNYPINSNYMLDNLKLLTDNIIKEVFDSNSYYNFSKKK